MRRARTVSLVGHGDLGASLVLIFPLVLVYEVGVLFAGRVNGADLVTRLVFALAGSRTAYLVIHALAAIGFLLWLRWPRGHGVRWGTLRLALAGPVILEAALYALTLGAVVSLVLDRLFGQVLGELFGHALAIGGARAPDGGGPGGLDGSSAISATIWAAVSAVIAALGAGVHEELVFRLGLIAGLLSLAAPIDRRLGSWLGSRLGSRLTVALAIAVAALVFAAAHHVGAHGEPWTGRAFGFRALAGVAFGAMFWFRSLAHAVYAHVFYDLLVAAAH